MFRVTIRVMTTVGLRVGLVLTLVFGLRQCFYYRFRISFPIQLTKWRSPKINVPVRTCKQPQHWYAAMGSRSYFHLIVLTRH